jgi:hypothetical protein
VPLYVKTEPVGFVLEVGLQNMEGDEDRIEESNARLVGRSNHNIVDG